MLTFIAIVLGAILLPVAAWALAGARRHRDPLLLPLLILALGFTLGGIGELLGPDGRFDWKLSFGILCFIAFGWRWRTGEGHP